LLTSSLVASAIVASARSPPERLRSALISARALAASSVPALARAPTTVPAAIAGSPPRTAFDSTLAAFASRRTMAESWSLVSALATPSASVSASSRLRTAAGCALPASFRSTSLAAEAARSFSAAIVRASEPRACSKSAANDGCSAIFRSASESSTRVLPTWCALSADDDTVSTPSAVFTQPAGSSRKDVLPPTLIVSIIFAETSPFGDVMRRYCPFLRVSVSPAAPLLRYTASNSPPESPSIVCQVMAPSLASVGCVEASEARSSDRASGATVAGKR
jgi:hypothetical protein